jgi:Xaa-Pro aminopeptidase
LEFGEFACLADGHGYPLEQGMAFPIEPKIVFPGGGRGGLDNSLVVAKDAYDVLTAVGTEVSDV